MPNRKTRSLPLTHAQAIGARVRLLRRELEQTQEHVAAAVGIARSVYGEIETGTGMGGLETMTALADYFKVSLDWLLCRTPDGDPLIGDFIQDADELAWLRLWKRLDDEGRSIATAVLKRGVPQKACG
jgi:transcriptional regulator with XRE-family HTH domain